MQPLYEHCANFVAKFLNLYQLYANFVQALCKLCSCPCCAPPTSLIFSWDFHELLPIKHIYLTLCKFCANFVHTLCKLIYMYKFLKGPHILVALDLYIHGYVIYIYAVCTVYPDNCYHNSNP
jgi:hypothetical protein